MCFLISQVIFWRFILSGVFGYILHRQSKDEFWTRLAEARGSTKQESFEEWKRVYNLTLTISHVSFIVCALRYADWDLMSLFQIPDFLFVFRVTAGTVSSTNSTLQAQLLNNLFVADLDCHQHLELCF